MLQGFIRCNGVLETTVVFDLRCLTRSNYPRSRNHMCFVVCESSTAHVLLFAGTKTKTNATRAVADTALWPIFIPEKKFPGPRFWNFIRHIYIRVIRKKSSFQKYHTCTSTLTFLGPCWPGFLLGPMILDLFYWKKFVDSKYLIICNIWQHFLTDLGVKRPRDPMSLAPFDSAYRN